MIQIPWFQCCILLASFWIFRKHKWFVVMCCFVVGIKVWLRRYHGNTTRSRHLLGKHSGINRSTTNIKSKSKRKVKQQRSQNIFNNIYGKTDLPFSEMEQTAESESCQKTAFSTVVHKRTIHHIEKYSAEKYSSSEVENELSEDCLDPEGPENKRNTYDIHKRDSWLWFCKERPSSESFATRREKFNSKDPFVAKLAAEIEHQDMENKDIERSARSLIESSLSDKTSDETRADAILPFDEIVLRDPEKDQKDSNQESSKFHESDTFLPIASKAITQIYPKDTNHAISKFQEPVTVLPQTIKAETQINSNATKQNTSEIKERATFLPLVVKAKTKMVLKATKAEKQEFQEPAIVLPPAGKVTSSTNKAIYSATKISQCRIVDACKLKVTSQGIDSMNLVPEQNKEYSDRQNIVERAPNVALKVQAGPLKSKSNLDCQMNNKRKPPTGLIYCNVFQPPEVPTGQKLLANNLNISKAVPTITRTSFRPKSLPNQRDIYHESSSVVIDEWCYYSQVFQNNQL